MTGHEGLRLESCAALQPLSNGCDAVFLEKVVESFRN